MLIALFLPSFLTKTLNLSFLIWSKSKWSTLHVQAIPILLASKILMLAVPNHFQSPFVSRQLSMKIPTPFFVTVILEHHMSMVDIWLIIAGLYHTANG